VCAFSCRSPQTNEYSDFSLSFQSRTVMGVPVFVTGISLGSNAILSLVGVADFFSATLPLVGEPIGTCGAACFASNLVGSLLIAKSVSTLTAVLSNPHEGTFVRRNLLLAIGACDLLVAISVYSASKNTLSIIVSTALFAEAGAFIQDAVFRKRITKPV